MREKVNMSAIKNKNTDKKHNDENSKDRINTDPFGSWTGVCKDDRYDLPIQDADDL